MAQLSRPYQIGLAAVAVLFAAWLLLLRGHGESAGSSGSASSAPAVQHTASAPSSHAATGNAGQATGGGSASSLGAYGKAIEKARGAVATSQNDAKRLEERSNQASSATPTTSSSGASTSTHSSSSSPAAKSSSPAAKTNSKPSAAAAGPARQHAVEAQLAKGKIAVILFWDPTGSDDRLVHSAVRSLRGDHKLNIAIDDASAGEVASFGSITRGVQVYGTPTMLIVNKEGKARILTGLQDSFAIAQAVSEARQS